jgi:murein DD-endopeptidase MepM/ murein hydrolase activator NlpD
MRRFLLILILIFASGVFVDRAHGLPEKSGALLGRPIPANRNSRVDLGFPYGWHRKNTAPIHHGVDMNNAKGTPILAAADGTVVFAESDAGIAVGARTNFYGNVVIIQHDFSAPEGGAVSTLYGHMRNIAPAVVKGARVTRGQPIGTVGMTGIAIGSHLHFEVRVGDPLNYNAVRNPELWLEPLPGTGTLIGRMKDVNGNLARGVAYTVIGSRRLPGFTYADPSIPSDPTIGENFAMTDLRAGCYKLQVRNAYDGKFCIKAGERLIFDFQLTR